MVATKIVRGFYQHHQRIANIGSNLGHLGLFSAIGGARVCGAADPRGFRPSSVNDQRPKDFNLEANNGLRIRVS